MKFLFDWHSQDSRATGPLDVANTVTAQYGTGGGNAPMVVHECSCLAGNFCDRETNQNGSGMRQGACFTLNTVDRHAVAYDARNGTLNEELSGTLQAKESGGWSLNYINPVIESSNPAGVLCMASTQANAERLMDCGTTLNLDRDRTIIAHRNEATVNYTFGKTSRPHFKGDAPTYLQLDTANTVNTFDTGESRANELAVQGVPPHYIVRRLMPIECGRLQGFPDGWGEIERLSADMPEEVAAFWRGVYTTERAIKGKRAQKSILERVDKLVEWYNRLHTDSAEYKMWGNGMALPNALFFVSRALAQISAEENRPVESLKLGSLFDGSGTMPLCATMCGAKAAWASEVEPYPIAVTKTHLPHMKHLGSVTEINGAEIAPVDIITFGSPCQDYPE